MDAVDWQPYLTAYAADKGAPTRDLAHAHSAALIWPTSNKRPEPLPPGIYSMKKGFAMYILTEYLDQAMAQAAYEKLDDGKYGGRIPSCPGVIAFAASQDECSKELRSTLEDWVLLGMKLAHPLPVIAGIDLNREPVHEPVDTL